MSGLLLNKDVLMMFFGSDKFILIKSEMFVEKRFFYGIYKMNIIIIATKEKMNDDDDDASSFYLIESSKTYKSSENCNFFVFKSSKYLIR